MTVSQTDPDQLRPSEGDNRGAIVKVGPARRTEAILRLVATGGPADRAAAERFLDYARTNAVSLDGLWSRVDRDGRLAHSVLAVPNAGRTAMVFASHPRGPADVAPLAELVDHVCRQIDGNRVELVQALLEPGEQREREALLGAGFTELATLSYLERPLSRAAPPPPQWPADVRLAPYRPELYDALVTVLEQSYEDTLDCPGLYGLRRTEDIIAGHQATGRYEADLWTLLWVNDRPAGAILLNPFPDHRTVELVYLGLAPFARGRGLGRSLLRHGLRLLAGRRERTVTLAVDQRNAPALAIYGAEGMRTVVERVALIRSLRR